MYVICAVRLTVERQCSSSVSRLLSRRWLKCVEFWCESGGSLAVGSESPERQV